MFIFGPPDVEKLKEKGDIKGLFKALNYQKDANIRKNAAQALVKFGAPAVESLVQALEDTDQHVCKAAVEALLQIGGSRALKPLTALFRENISDRDFLDYSRIRKFLRILESCEIKPAMDNLAAVYWISGKQWDKCSKIGTGVVPLLKALVTDGTVETYEQQYAVNTLKKVLNDSGDIELSVSLLKETDERIRKTAFNILQKSGWKPVEDIQKAAFWIAGGDVNRLSKLNIQEIRPLLLESIDWQMNWYEKGKITQLIIKTGISNTDSISARVSAELDIFAEKYSETLLDMVNNIGYWKKSRDDERKLFEDYADLIVTACSYNVKSEGDGQGGMFYSYDTKSSLNAVKSICKIETPVSTNLLHHISRIQDIEVVIRSAEVEYSKEHPSGIVNKTDLLSYKRHREAAKTEIARRGNPDYDLSVYKSGNCWSFSKKR